MNDDIDALLENKALKDEFAIRNLDLKDVFNPTPDDLQRENRCLSDLLEWVQKYLECGDRETMEQQGYKFPPIDPDISPENDWFIFQNWMNGRPVRMTVRGQLPAGYMPRPAEALTDDEVNDELQKLEKHLSAIRIAVDYKDGTPPRLQYSHLLERLEEEVELTNEGVWVFDGCGGCCPFCFQRPWCEFGVESCWTEDEEAGEMYLLNEVKKYVSATSISLEILQKYQQKEDADYEEFLKSYEKRSPHDSISSEFDDDDDLPF